jgi:tetratricopeptide (TPR) repeat protein
MAPDDAKTRCLLADAYVLMGNFAEAHGLLDDAITSSKRTSPDLYMFHHRKAYIASAEGDHPTQLECLKKAHQSARKNGPIAAELADLAEALQQWDLAVATLRTITTLDAGECPISAAVALVRQARIALLQGDDKRARLCARRAAMTDAEAEGVQQLLAELGEA